jgi:hypothetical protein
MDYASFLRATQLCTNDVREKGRAFERVVFNVIFNNRDDHPKNFAYLMSANGNWSLAPAFDITFCDGPGGYHQMDVMGEALTIEREHLMNLGIREAELEESRVNEIIDRIASVATTFSKKCHELLPGKVTWIPLVISRLASMRILAVSNPELRLNGEGFQYLSGHRRLQSSNKTVWMALPSLRNDYLFNSRDRC